MNIPAWFKISLLLSVFGLVKEFRPSEPYIYEFLTGPQWRNLSETDVVQEVYPVGTYSYLGLLVIVFLVTDFCRYKPLIVLLGASGIVIYSLLLWTTSLVWVQVLEVFYGFFMASEVAYYTYIYAKVPKAHYQIVTSCTRVAVLLGRFTAALVAQLLLLFKLMDYRDLNYLTLGAMIIATCWSFLLPSVPQSLYFHQSPGQSLGDKYRDAFKLLWKHSKTAFGKLHVLKWSLWWALATCGFIQVESYMQPLWGEILTANNDGEKPNYGDKNVYNGAVTATITILGAVVAIIAGILTVDWKMYGEVALAVCSLLGGGALIVSAVTTNIWVCYAGYVVFGVLYQFMITVASYEVACNIPEDSYGLIFGVNTLMALVFQSILTFVVVSKSGFSLAPHDQYLVYGGYHAVIGGVFLVFVIVKLIRYRK